MLFLTIQLALVSSTHSQDVDQGRTRLRFTKLVKYALAQLRAVLLLLTKLMCLLTFRPLTFYGNGLLAIPQIYTNLRVTSFSV
jgi:hypothetical protein